MTFVYYSLLTLLLFFAVMLILLILIQKGRGGGLSSAFGGGGGSTAFGAKTGDVLTWATSSIFGLFIVLAVVLDLVVNSQYKTASPSVTSANPVPAMPATNEPLNPTPPPASAIPVSTPPTTAPALDINALKTQLQNAANQAVTKAKSTTQP